MRFKSVPVAIVATAALALGACSGSGDNSSSGLTPADVPVVDHDKLEKGGTLRLDIGGWPDDWNQSSTAGNTADNTKMYHFASVINWIYADDASFEPNPNFIKSYEYKAPEGDQKQVVTLNLNEDAIWNDGSPIDVDDYQTTWKACSGQIEGVSCASSDGWNEIESIEAGDSNFQVVVTYKTAYPDWSANMSTVFPADGYGSKEAFESWNDPVEISTKWTTGPYKFTKANSSSKIVTMERNEKWWGSEGLLDTITFQALVPAAAAAAFANNELDVVEPIISADTLQTVKSRKDHALKVAASPQWRHFTLNSNAGALKDEKVRQAIQYAIDRIDMTESDLAGMPVNAEDLLLGNHFFMPFQEGYEDHSYGHDPDKSKALLEEAGYTFNEGSGYFEKDGKPLTVKYLRMPDIHTSNNEGLVLQDNLKKVGIDLQFTDIEPDKFFDPVIAGEYEITSFTWVGTPYPMANVGQIYGDPATKNSNFAQLKIDKVDELIPQIASETDQKKRRELTNEADKAIWDAVHTIPIYNRAVIVAQPENLANYGSVAFRTLLPENIGYTKVEQK